MRRFRQFIRSKTHKKDSKEPEEDPPLPSLPLTTTHDPDTWRPTSQTQGFFALPYDLRYQILKMAFGGRTVHIDLRLRPPLLDFESSGGRSPGHAGYPPLFDSDSRSDPNHRGQGVAWRWFHCVCHRDPPGVYHPDEVCRDTCLTGQALCQGHSWAWDACRLGAMGFLLCCKQGHDDLLDVLYGTNTIYIESMPLIEALGFQGHPDKYRLLGPGASFVTFLQLRVNLVLFSSSDTPKETLDRSRLDLLLKGLIGRFPRLNKLEVAFEEHMYDMSLAPFFNMPAIEQHLLHPLLAVSQQNESVTISFSFPEPFYCALLRGFLDQHKDKNGMTTRTMRGRWMWYPFADNWGDLSQGNGYWIKAGVRRDIYWGLDGTPRSESWMSGTRMCG